MIGVSRETVIDWYSGSPIPQAEEDRIQELLSVVQKLPGSTSAERRAALAQNGYWGMYQQLDTASHDYSVVTPETEDDTRMPEKTKIISAMIYGWVPILLGLTVLVANSDIICSTLISMLTVILLPVAVYEEKITK